MSRTIKQNADYLLAYGIDDIEGLFVEVRTNGALDIEENGDSDMLLVNLNQKYIGLTLNQIITIAEDYGFDLSEELNNQIIQ